MKSRYVITMKSYFSKLDTMYLKDSNVFRHTVTCSSVQFSSFAQSCPTICDPMNRSTPGLPVHHQLPEFTHVHRVSDAIQPSHPLPSPSPPAHSPSHRIIIFVCMHHCSDVQCTITCQASLSTGILQARILEFITE